MIAGFLSVPIFKFAVPAIDSIGVYFANIAELGPSFIVGLLVGYVVSKLYPDEELRTSFEESMKSHT